MLRSARSTAPIALDPHPARAFAFRAHVLSYQHDRADEQSVGPRGR